MKTDLQFITYGIWINLNIEISFTEPYSGSMTLLLNDLSGRLIYKQSINGTNTKYSIDVTGLNPGIYLLKVFSEKNTFLKKVIISK